MRNFKFELSFHGIPFKEINFSPLVRLQYWRTSDYLFRVEFCESFCHIDVESRNKSKSLSVMDFCDCLTSCKDIHSFSIRMTSMIKTFYFMINT